MTTEFMQLNTARDADVWAGQFGLETAEQEKNVSDYLWNNKPRIGCTYEEFKAANPEFEDEEKFWRIADSDQGI